MTATVVVAVDERGDLVARLFLGVEAAAGQQLVLESRVEALGRRVVQRGADRPIDWVISSAVHASGEQVAGVLAALVGVEDHAGDIAAAHRGGHTQRRLRE